VNIEDTSQLLEIDALKVSVLHRWPLAGCKEPSGLAFDQKNRRLFSVCGNKKMMVVNADTGEVVASLPIGEDPDAAGFDPEIQLVSARTANREISPSFTKIHPTNTPLWKMSQPRSTPAPWRWTPGPTTFFFLSPISSRLLERVRKSACEARHVRGFARRQVISQLAKGKRGIRLSGSLFFVSRCKTASLPRNQMIIAASCRLSGRGSIRGPQGGQRIAVPNCSSLISFRRTDESRPHSRIRGSGSSTL
jgi:hypothetical protein